jgi:TonB-linked SusC/RagA family outer membrane protein
MQQGWGKVPSKLNLLNTRQYIEMRKEAKMNDNAVISATDYDINGTWDSTKYTDWQKALLGGTSKYSDAQGSISGGNNLVQYLIGGGYHKETSVFPGDFTDQKGSMHINLNGASANQKFKVQTSINYLIDDNRLPSQDLTQKALQLSPNAPDLYNSDGSLNWALLPNGNATWINPLSFAIGYYKYRVNNLISNTTISYRIAKGLDIKTSFGYNKMLSDELQTTPMSSVSPPSRSSTLRRSVFGNGSMNSWILEPQITYNRKILNGNIEILVGSTFQESKNQQQQLTATGFNSDLVMEDIKSASSITANSNLISDYKYSAVFGRVNFNWAEKYIVNLTGRRDGSSRFGSANLFHNFGSIAGAWIFSKEKLLEQKLPLISFGKLRVSYGTTGNDQIGDYQFLNRYITTSGIAVAYQGIPSIEPDGIPNPYLQWEETKKLQFGLDLGILKNRILFNVNYARNRSSNQLLGYNLPIMTGVSGMIINFPATIENTSWELSLNTENLRFSNFRWNTNVNFTIPENKLIEFPNIESSSYASLLVIGKPFTIVKKYHFLGVDPAIGKYVFSDSKGNATSTPNTETDRTVIINTAPEFYAGFQNTFSFKGFELDFLFQYVKQKGANYSFGANRPGTMLNQPDYVLGRWQKPGDITSIQRYNSTTTLNLPYSFASGSSDAGYSDASFIRLRNVSFSWQLPPIWIRKLHLQNFRLYVHGQNLLTITDFKGLDPENKSTNSLPILRVITAGVQLSL